MAATARIAIQRTLREGRTSNAMAGNAPDEIGKLGLRRNGMPEEIVREQGVWQVQHALEGLTLRLARGAVLALHVALEQHVELLRAAPATPQQSTCPHEPDGTGGKNHAFCRRK
jgi:hypothetical protein